jgi:hypothetical protein
MNTLQKALFLLCGMGIRFLNLFNYLVTVMLAGALALPARSSHRASSRIAWPQLVEWNQVPLTAIKKWLDKLNRL